ncbi:hypothetical protein GGQ85_003243 [Nitrobacter vulgaris]|uniref:hypothetical protein n=1 Tax=Nitrobacter vulgaris TaxID=29421 RepID=UPI00285CF9B9|nr:hypothetical protein [Nitrobacter vulgaris]MDR6305519.1 hypothetical protein [Nitrobacter vulgaris]
MAEYYFSAKVDTDTTLCIAPLTEKRIELSGQQIPDSSGYFLFRTRGGGEPGEVEILARLESEEAAMQLREMLQLS